MSLKIKIGLFAGALQVATVLFGALQINPAKYGPLGSLAAAFMELAGTSRGYAFFAPDVGSHLHARFVVENRGGKTASDTLEQNANREVALKIGNVVDLLQDANEPARRALVASWAGTIFGRFPGAESVTVIVERETLAPLRDFARSPLASLTPVYRAKFLNVARPQSVAAETQKGKRL